MKRLTNQQRLLGGAAHGAVHKLLDGCWQQLPRIKQPAADKETPWEVKTGKMLASVRAWAKLRDLDRRDHLRARPAADDAQQPHLLAVLRGWLCR